MASDDDYMAFLDKANQDPSEGQAKPQSSDKQKGEFKATDDGAAVPAALKEATKDSFYVSDADEPFVPVCLAWDEGGKGLPDEEEFASLIHHPDPASAEIEIQDPADWDTQGQYRAILDAVTKAGKGNDVRVYRVAKGKGGVKVEYWVVTTEGKGAGAKLVGAKALAVES
ncbi:Uu.00g072690.m01.CDS01 [Anthostomella pinea]|uniref:Uu.00g072690.m01.CDS01 n=1 Tax=Anthostomella pinea TaxID=933095 RepID=A0AAI8YNR8_9PEZI|nr:Uu.00g072690.m01.CDS01 [Anthostomella pinea]